MARSLVLAKIQNFCSVTLLQRLIIYVIRTIIAFIARPFLHNR